MDRPFPAGQTHGLAALTGHATTRTIPATHGNATGRQAGETAYAPLSIPAQETNDVR